MGIFINLAIIPNRITKEVWREAYADAMRISDAGQLAIDGNGIREGNQFPLLFPAPTHTEDWACSGDLITGSNMETFYLPRELPEEDKKDNGADVLACYASADFGLTEPPLKFLWRSKTQGARAHIWLLAMAIAIHDYFPEAVYLAGDINAGQCIRACEIVKKVLGKDVRLPIRFRYDELLEHVRELGIQDSLQEFALFMRLYLGLETDDYRTFLWAQFPPETIYAYFRGETRPSYVNWTMRSWFRSGGDFAALCRMLVTDPEGPQLLPEVFVKEVLAAGIHLENKYLYDPSDLDNRLRAEPDSIGMLFRRITAKLTGLGNTFIDYYLPLEEIQRICAETFGADCDIPAVFAAAEKACVEDPAEQRRREFLDKIRAGGNDTVENVAIYDCNVLSDMYYWKEGASVDPALDRKLRNAIRAMKSFSVFSEPVWTEGSPAERKQALSETLKWGPAVPTQILDQILANIMDDSFVEKYAALWTIDPKTSAESELVQIMTMNPELFTYYWESTDALETPQKT